MAEDDTCSLFFKLKVEDVTCSDDLEKYMKNASNERKPLIEPVENQLMDIDDEGGSVDYGLLYLYVDCRTMMCCFHRGSLPYNWMQGALLTNLPPYQHDVTLDEVNRGLKQALGFFGYADPMRSAYFTAFSFPGRVTKLNEQMELPSTKGKCLKFDLYASTQLRFKPDELVRHGECKFAIG
uniref:RolC-like protein variant 1 n=1 Tax=Linaria creticola TaxID=1315787 RepID=A0A346H5Z9_9LAMI|nr:RolC-like protein variant 1 [Linaria creticola]